VSLTRDGTTAPAQPGPLRLKDSLETGADGSAEIEFPDGHVIVLSKNARFVLDEKDGTLVLSLAQGTLISRVAADALDGGTHIILNVQTPYGLTRLGRDAQNVELSTADGGYVDVKLGQIEMTDKSGKSATAKAGERLQLDTMKVELKAPVPPPVQQLQSMEVVLRANSGAEVKLKGSARWRKAAAKGEPLNDGTSVRTGRGPARLNLGDARTTLELSPASEVVVGPTDKSGEREETQLQLKRGRVVEVARPGTQTALVLPELTILGDPRGTRYEVRRAGKAIDVRAVAGDLTVQRDGKDEAVIAGAERDLAGSNSASKQLGQSPLKLPTRNGTRVFHSGVPEVTLTWPESKDDYLVQVAEDPAFEQTLLEGTVHSSNVTLPTPRHGALYWKIKGEKDDDLKGSAVFAPESYANDLQRVRNEVPDGAEKTTIFYQDKPPSLTFTFKPVEQAAHYKLAVFKVTELKSPVTEKDTDEPKVKLDEGALSEGSYVWSITPLSAEGEVLPGRGRMNKLEMIYDNAVPQLIVTSPRNGDSASGKIQARGIAPLRSRVYINGKPAPMDGQGRFETTASAVGPPPIVVFKLSRPNEPDSLTVRTLR
jgi:ferric-dicitrate binding protein FerR (iron transport regulator)